MNEGEKHTLAQISFFFRFLSVWLSSNTHLQPCALDTHVAAELFITGNPIIFPCPDCSLPTCSPRLRAE